MEQANIENGPHQAAGKDTAPPAARGTSGDPGDPLVALLGAIAHGDRAAFERLYGLSAPKLFAVCAKMLRRDDLAEEVLQEAFVQIWKSAAQYDPHRASPMTWMARIARNRAIDLIRRRQAEAQAHVDTFDPEQSETDELGPLEQSLDWSQAAAVRGCLELLSESQRTTVLLAFFRGYTHVELARVLTVPLGTVKSRIHQGLQRLKRCLEA